MTIYVFNEVVSVDIQSVEHAQEQRRIIFSQYQPDSCSVFLLLSTSQYCLAVIPIESSGESIFRYSVSEDFLGLRLLETGSYQCYF